MNFTAAGSTSRAGLLRSTENAHRFFIISQVSERLRTCDRTVCRWIARKELIVHHFGGATRIASEDLVDFITRARRGPVPLQPVNPLEQKFYAADEIANLLRVCVRTVRRHIESERLATHNSAASTASSAAICNTTSPEVAAKSVSSPVLNCPGTSIVYKMSGKRTSNNRSMYAMLAFPNVTSGHALPSRDRSCPPDHSRKEYPSE